MRMRRFAALMFVVAAIVSLSWVGIASGQGAATPAAPAKRPATAAKTATAKPQAEGTLIQVMRAILFPNSNVIFAAQSQDPAAIKPDADPSASVNPLSGSYGGWQAVGNSSIALAEAANLLTIPGRMCSNGRPVPLQNADWAKFVQELRDAGMASYKAAQSKSQDAIVDVSDKVTTACADCHNVYRDKTTAQGGLAARCTK
jgi:hypothetical protein